MKLPEKAAYLKGLMEGLNLDTTKPEGKLLAAIVDMLDETAESIADLYDVLDAIEEYLLDEEDDEEEYEDEDEFDFGDDEVIYEVTCPVCGEVIDLDEEMMDAGSIACPKCGENLEFDESEEDA